MTHALCLAIQHEHGASDLFFCCYAGAPSKPHSYVPEGEQPHDEKPRPCTHEKGRADNDGHKWGLRVGGACCFLSECPAWKSASVCGRIDDVSLTVSSVIPDERIIFVLSTPL